MRFVQAICLALGLLCFADAASAQFSQPPPVGTPAPTCSTPKSSAMPSWEGSDCRVKNLPSLLGSTLTMLDCADHAGMVVCVTSTDIYENGQWDTLDPSTLTYYWAYVVDGQEYYLTPSNSDFLYVDCGNSGQVYLRVTAGGSTAQTSFNCGFQSHNPW